MYYLNEETKEKLKQYKITAVSKAIGIQYRTLSDMIKNNKSCLKLTAYALSKFLNNENEIENCFIRKEQ